MKTILTVFSTVFLLTACNTTSEGTLCKATANTLNLGEHEFTISNKQYSATDIKCDAITKAGKRYQCTFSALETALNKSD